MKGAKQTKLKHQWTGSHIWHRLSIPRCPFYLIAFHYSDNKESHHNATVCKTNSYLQHISGVGYGGGDDSGENATHHISQQRLI